MSSQDSPPNEEGQVLSLSQFRLRKKLANEISGDRPSLASSQLNGESGGKATRGPDDLVDRLLKIRQNLERINLMMSELKKISDKKTPPSKG